MIHDEMSSVTRISYSCNNSAVSANRTRGMSLRVDLYFVNLIRDSVEITKINQISERKFVIPR